eukprot:TRINITY_DN93560_c0_g1_i1.p1 TRINITY_DN93560_c0_g1~~TRINITY_DN93560_c0_g1_i1.p1  ORF type:complete len:270 (+),score=52.62 TRINITY_DN93560_c0_g1_i1:23-832(+)
MALFLMQKWDELQKRTQKWREILTESATKLKDVDFVSLRPMEDCLIDYAGLVSALDKVRGELQGVSPACAIAVGVVALKAMRVMNKMIDVALQELLSRQGFFTRGLLAYSAFSGWAGVYAYWGTITKHLDVVAWPRAAGPYEGGAEWILQLIRNLKRLPALFWISGMASCLVTLQMGQAVGVRSVRRAARSLLGALLLQLLGVGVGVLAVHSTNITAEQMADLRQRTRRALSDLAARLPSSGLLAKDDDAPVSSDPAIDQAREATDESG